MNNSTNNVVGVGYVDNDVVGVNFMSNSTDNVVDVAL